MLRWYHSSKALPHICFHSPALLRAHCKEATAGTPMVFMIQALFSRTRLCCTSSLQKSLDFFSPDIDWSKLSPYHSKWLLLLSIQHLPKMQVTKVQDTTFSHLHVTALQGTCLQWQNSGAVLCRIMPCHVSTLSQSMSANTA